MENLGLLEKVDTDGFKNPEEMGILVALEAVEDHTLSLRTTWSKRFAHLLVIMPPTNGPLSDASKRTTVEPEFCKVHFTGWPLTAMS